MQENVSSARVALKYGVITAVAVIVYSTVINVSGLAQNRALASLSFFILIGGIVWAMKDYREQSGGFMTYGEGLSTGSLVAAIVGVLAATFTMFYMEFIDTTIMQQSLDRAREEMEGRGLDDAQIDQAMAISQKFMSPGIMFFTGVITYLIIGFIISLVVAAVMRKTRPVFE
ncbi:DUF4199 domain-containing protein [Telluribacter sp. SYSU D00476]|uniref:DUF4199 domain-containing protein n=1 Tax=Telluribacter sp. SYSU D00476 TaxID=2811430 RepID=UPI001FF55655|nr:DUF4199 domain-containing protein [Telluribacter sp. SYSU D00476]